MEGRHSPGLPGLEAESQIPTYTPTWAMLSFRPGLAGAEGQHFPPGSSLWLWQRSAEGSREAE